MRIADRLVQLAVPAVLVVAVGILGSFTSRANEIEFRSALVDVAIVVALYVFVGNSGVLSFGHVSFVAVGAFAAGVMTVDAQVKPNVLPELNPFLAEHSIGNVESLLLAAGLGGVFAFLVGLPLMRLSGLAAGIATFAVLGITHNVLFYWMAIGPGPGTLSLVPETTDLFQATVGAVIVIAVAWAYQLSRLGRLLRATREDAAVAQAVGVSVHRQRLWAFTLSGALCGFAGGLLVHLLGSVSANQVYLELTFITLAMLVVGGAGSLLGAVVGALLISGLDAFVANAEDGVAVLGGTLDVPSGTRLVVLGAVMALVLILRPSGITGGREARLPPRWGRGRSALAREARVTTGGTA
jgi:branched-chain amino acid transport system permease protein